MQPGGSREPGLCQFFLLRYASQTYLELNLGLCNVSLAAASVGNLLCLADLVPDSLSLRQPRHPSFLITSSYLGAEVLQWVTLDGVNAENRVWLHNGESTGEEELLAAA